MTRKMPKGMPRNGLDRRGNTVWLTCGDCSYSGPPPARHDAGCGQYGTGCAVVLALPVAAVIGLLVTAHEAGWV